MFSNSYGSVKKCGLFISRKFPQFGASPDGIFQDYLVEVKCPYALKDTTPTNISNLTPAQRKTFFLISSENGVELDTKHKYYSQCQWQMFVTGFRKTKFVIQTPFSIFVQDIHYDEKHIFDLLPAINDHYDNIFVPETFEMRIPRGLPPLKLLKNEKESLSCVLL